MAKILRTPDGKIVRVQRDTDTVLYAAPRNPPNTGTAYTRGTDIYAHVARSGKAYFYAYRWTMWQGEENSYDLMDEQEVKDFLLDKAQLCGWAGLKGEELQAIQRFFPNLFEETA